MVSDIVSRWEEPIDEEKLDRLADQELVLPTQFDKGGNEIPYSLTIKDIKEIWKAGYRRALNK